MVLPGVTRKVGTVFLLLSLVGWITFGVGFGFRNFEYSKVDNLSRGTLYPDFTYLWLFGISFPVLFVLSVIDLFCAYRATTSLTYLLLPLYLVTAGAILFLNGHYIYQHYRVETYNTNNRTSQEFSDLNLKLLVIDISLVTEDFSLSPGLLEDIDIHGNDSYIPIEFAGTITAVFFTWLYLMISPFFSSRIEYDVYD